MLPSKKVEDLPKSGKPGRRPTANLQATKMTNL
jgi:hypothetical protein